MKILILHVCVFAVFLLMTIIGSLMLRVYEEVCQHMTESEHAEVLRRQHFEENDLTAENNGRWTTFPALNRMYDSTSS